MKIGDRVKTKHGVGVIKEIEKVSDYHPRFGVLHDVYPEKFPHFKNDLLYYFKNEIEIIAKIIFVCCN